MYEELSSYPFRGAWLERTITGSLLVVGSVLVVPLLVLAGYGVRVLETTLEGVDEPPSLEGWRRLATRGGGVVAITFGYLVAPLAVTAVVGGLVAAGGYYGLAGLAPLVGGDETVVWLISAVAALLAALLALVAVAAILVVYYFLPAALVQYAATGSMRAAFDRRAVALLGLNGRYFLAVAILQIVPLVVPIVAVVAAVTVVGVLVIPAVVFLAGLVSCRVLGVAATDSRV